MTLSVEKGAIAVIFSSITVNNDFSMKYSLRLITFSLHSAAEAKSFSDSTNQT